MNNFLYWVIGPIFILFGPTKLSCQEIDENTRRSIVKINSYSSNPLTGEKENEESGTGIVFTIGDSGKAYILTAKHVLVDNESIAHDKVIISFWGNDIKYKATIFRSDFPEDVAVLEINNYPSNLGILKIGDSNIFNLTEDVLVYGYPGGGDPTIVKSNFKEEKEGILFCDQAGIVEGYSGGPILYHETNEVLGIVIESSVNQPFKALSINYIKKLLVEIDIFKDYIKSIKNKPLFFESSHKFDKSTSINKSIATGDIDNDGDIDIILDNSLYINNGYSWEFSGQTFGDAQGWYKATVMVDINQDGKLDVINNSILWVNNSKGHFIKTEQKFGEGPETITVGDIDNDGDIDIIAGTKIWLNQGNNKFLNTERKLSNNYFDIVKLADFDLDGDLDAVATGAINKVFLNNGQGKFSSLQGVGYQSKSVDVGDINNDGYVDLVFANPRSRPNEIYLYNKEGSYFKNTLQQVGNSSSTDVALKDLDNDGDLDLFVTNADTDNIGGEPNKFWINDGKGNFSDRGQSLGLDSSEAVALEDLDKDGDIDAIIVNYRQNKRGLHSIWLNSGFDITGNFKTYKTDIGNVVSQDVVLEDFDGDGDLDAMVTGQNYNSFLANDGKGNFSRFGPVLKPFNKGHHSSPENMAVGDVDNDGDIDVVGAYDKYNQLWYNKNNEFHNSNVMLDSLSSTDIELEDLDSDGDLDVFITNRRGPNRIWINDGLGNFENSEQDLGSMDSNGVAMGDLDNDGDIDVFIANSKSNKVWINDGNGKFKDSGQNLGNSYSTDIALGDIDNDGDLDAFVVNRGQETLPNEVWFNDGNAKFTSSQQKLGNYQSYRVKLSDLDNDGDLDAFVVNGFNDPDAIYWNNGDGKFVIDNNNFPESSSHSLDIGDIDNDGDEDIFVTRFSKSNIIYFNN